MLLLYTLAPAAGLRPGADPAYIVWTPASLRSGLSIFYLGGSLIPPAGVIYSCSVLLSNSAAEFCGRLPFWPFICPLLRFSLECVFILPACEKSQIGHILRAVFLTLFYRQLFRFRFGCSLYGCGLCGFLLVISFLISADLLRVLLCPGSFVGPAGFLCCFCHWIASVPVLLIW